MESSSKKKGKSAISEILLEKNPLCRLVTQDCFRCFVRKEFKEAIGSSKTNEVLQEKLRKIKISQREEYVRRVFDRIMNLHRSLTRLEDTQIFLGISPEKTKKKISRSEYISYHLENYYLGVTGVFDRAILLAAEVYDLGLAEQDCKLQVISRNRKFSSTQPLRVLRKIDQALEKAGHRRQRNKLTHQCYFSDSDLVSIEMFEKAATDPGKPKTFTESPAYRDAASAILSKLYRRKKRDEIKESLASLLSAADALMSSLEKTYTKIRDSISDTRAESSE